MKNLLLFVGLVLLGLASVAQPNLVRNPDFENGPTPSARGEIDHADFWTENCTDPEIYLLGGEGIDLLDKEATLSAIDVPMNDWGNLNERTGDDRYAHLWQQEHSTHGLIGERLKGELTSALPKGNYSFCFWAAVAPNGLSVFDQNKQIVEVFLVDGNDCPADGILIHTTTPVPYNSGTPVWTQYCSSFSISSSQANTYDRIVFQLKDPEGTGAFFGHNQSVYIDEVEMNKNCDEELDLGSDITLCIGETATLDITGQVPPGTTVAWFLDGMGIFAPPGATSIDVSSEGTYTVTTTDIYGCVYNESINVAVIDCDACGFIASFNFSITGCTVDFTSFIGTEIGDPPPTIIGYLWVFGDGSTSTEMNPSHFYPSPGSHTVTLFIYGLTPNGDCCVVQKTKTVVTTIGCMPTCFVSASFVETDNGDGSFTFNSTSSTNGFTSIVGYEWTINGFVVSNEASFSQSFNKGIVCLTVYGLTELGECCTQTVCVNYTGNKNKSLNSGENELKTDAKPSGMHVYPNPANSDLKIELALEESQSATVTILDATGKEVYSAVSAQTSFLIETTEFSEGLYFVSVFVEGEKVDTKKVIVKH